MPVELARIVRYPVKGLRGVETPQARLAPGGGLRGDRVLAIERGVLPVERPDGWNPRGTYFHLAKTEQIARFDTALTGADEADAVVTVTSPAGRSVDIRLSADGFESDRESADAFLGAELPAGPLGPPRIARTGVQLWDWPGSQVSIINLASLRALGEAAGRPLDHRRFRANLYLDGLEPWQEFTLLGTRLRIGEVELEVFQPTDRCRATTIDPMSAASDVNVPALLAAKFGHMFCGVYARPVTEGILRRHDAVEILAPGTAEPDGAGALDAAGELDGSGKLDGSDHEWPRAARLLERVDESAGVTSFWFRDAAGYGQGARPGQHIRVHLPGEAFPAWRCYTISGVRDDAFRVSVKRDGRISGALHDRFAAGSGLVITGPFGDVTVDPEDTSDLVLLSAGVGITPTVAMLRALVAAGARRRVRVLHVDRDPTSLPLWEEVRAAADRLDASVRLHLTRAGERITDEDVSGGDVSNAIAGRPGAADYLAVLDGLDPDAVQVYACGPAAFTAEVRQVLAGLGVGDDRIHVEVFFSPTTADLAEPREPSTAGPHEIRVGDDAIPWTRDTGSILDAVEGAGIPLPSGCRTGVCGTCAQTLVSGEVEYLQDPLAPPARGRVLVCCSVPVRDVVLEVRPAD